MKLRHLRIFKIVCEEGNITRASEKLFISQPAVSKAIHELENFLEIELFDRIGGRIHVNETGKLFLLKTTLLLDQYDNLINEIKDLEKSVRIKIGSSITIANYILPKAIAEFERVYNSTPISVSVANAEKIEELLNKNEIDIALIEGIVSNEDLVDIPCSTYDLVVLCSVDHPFSLQTVINIEELLAERLLLREKGSAIRDVFDSALAVRQLNVIPDWISINSQSLIQAVKRNLGITVLPKILVADELREGTLVEVAVENLHMENVNHILFHKNKFQSKNFHALIDIIQKTAQESSL